MSDSIRRRTQAARRGLAALLVGALLGSLDCSRAAPAIDINAYRLIEQPLPAGDAPGTRTWMNAVRFDGSDAVIPLSRSKRWMTPEPMQASFAAQSLRITWLAPGRLMHLRWGGLPSHGSGWLKTEGQLVLEVDGTRVSEVFRTVFQAYLKVGMGNYQSDSLHISFDGRLPC